ncbi:transcription factor bHLH112-like isoform X1 [Iris pallida]|uniref:Transcription factor bHLH112-like isoform X1 n=1 Tax=Iris pallida TaxID=29817 RepID=A0AAX6HMV1_IRIPA|nr:transcription factor bHLH112-like isoform X1 [Iris pallida]
MADGFDAGICSGSWWNTARINSSAGLEASGMATSVSCSSANTDSSGGGAFSWLSTADVEPANSVTDTPMPFSGSGLSPTPSMNWNQSLLSNIERDETSFHHMLQETPNYFRQDSSNLLNSQEVNQQQFLLGAQQRQPGFPAMLQELGLFQPEAKPRQSIYQPTSSLMMGNNYTQLLKFSPPKQQSTSSTSNHLLFSNNAYFWNPSASVVDEVKSELYPSSVPVQFLTRSFEQKPNCSSITAKSNTYSASKKSSCSNSSEASLKKPRLETPSPLPTFKVRKEKLGDRITALQQLVSPFGKTDTASVLHEAIDYIKFLHDQVNVLSTPYLKNGYPMQHLHNSDKSKDGEGTKQDLRSRGLCLVPMESIYPVASETTADFWTPTFGGTCG